jgi:hypothetical protein
LEHKIKVDIGSDLSSGHKQVKHGKDNKIDGHQGTSDDEGKKGSIVAFPNTVVEPDAMVIIVF